MLALMSVMDMGATATDYQRQPVAVYNHPSPEYFRTIIVPKRRPALLKDVPFGDCLSRWDVDYLSQHVGSGRPVSVHESSHNRLRFLNRNFAYKVMPFGEFVRKASMDNWSDGKLYYYYRAVADDDPRKNVADFRKDFPELAADFVLPSIVDSDGIFSCVFRCGSADLGLWLHYDVMDNVLVQVCGRKRAVLFDPEDVEFLYVEGDKSQIFDPENVDLAKYPLFTRATQQCCVMEPGDILFIPAFWMHYMVSEEFSVAVNVFWYNLPKELYDSGDTYGNKEMLPYFRAAQGVGRAIKQLDDLPADIRRFYLRLLRSKIESALR